MKTGIEVKDRKEAKLIKNGLNDPEVRALVKIMGALSTLEDRKTKAACLRFVADKFDIKVDY